MLFYFRVILKILSDVDEMLGIVVKTFCLLIHNPPILYRNWSIYQYFLFVCLFVCFLRDMRFAEIRKVNGVT